MSPSLSAVCTLMCWGTSAAFVVPSASVSCLARGTVSHRRSFAAAAALTGSCARQQRLSPLFMEDDGGKDDGGKANPDIMSKVRSIVVSQLAVEEIQVVPEASFTQDLGADSLDTVELIMALEEGFDIEIEDEVAAEIATVQQAVDFISKSS